LCFGGLPTGPLARFDELDAKDQQLLAQREKCENRLAALTAPSRFGGLAAEIRVGHVFRARRRPQSRLHCPDLARPCYRKQALAGATEMSPDAPVTLAANRIHCLHVVVIGGVGAEACQPAVAPQARFSAIPS
jgi:hypothetical protein